MTAVNTALEDHLQDKNGDPMEWIRALQERWGTLPRVRRVLVIVDALLSPPDGMSTGYETTTPDEVRATITEQLLDKAGERAPQGAG